MKTDIASISTKGQFVIPRPFRDILKLSAGTKMVIMCDGKNLLLRPIPRPETQAFKAVIDGANELAKKATAKAKGGRK